MLEYPVYVRMPTENDKPYFKNQSCAEAVISVVIHAQMQGWLRLHGFVVMPDALEMVASPIRQGTAGMVAYLQAETIPHLTILLPSAGLVWAPRYSEVPLTSQRSLDARLNIMLLVPVANGIADSASSYPYSSANSRYAASVSLYAGFARMLPQDDDLQTSLSEGRVAAPVEPKDKPGGTLN